MTQKTQSRVPRSDEPADTREERSARLEDLRRRRAEVLDVIAEGLFALLVREGEAHGAEETSRREGST